MHARGLGQPSVEEVESAIREVVARRQRLRRYDAGGQAVERNRLELVHLQQQLSHALIERHCRAPAAAAIAA
jgi:hypothetical protein